LVSILSHEGNGKVSFVSSLVREEAGWVSMEESHLNGFIRVYIRLSPFKMNNLRIRIKLSVFLSTNALDLLPSYQKCYPNTFGECMP
jgi:hypothetical protein